jgi:predicted DCC family thiol-disulfide oxidoreductase YuxK
MPNHRQIVFYDGNCGLCDASVRWILDHDRRGIFNFAPLQGKTYESLETDDKPNDLSTLVLYDGNTLWTRSSAAVRVLWGIGGIWGMLGRLAWCLPRPLRNAAYRFIASRRLKWFGGAENCKLPSPAESARILP